MKEQAALANTDAFTRILEVLADAELRLRDAASKKILLEVSLLRAIEARNALPLDAVLKQLNQLRGQSGAGVPPAAAQVTASARRPEHIFRFRSRASPRFAQNCAAPSPAPVAQAAVAVPASGDLTELWHKLVDAVGRVSPFTRGYLIDAHPVSFEKNVFVIGFDPEFEDHLGLVDNARNHTLLATKLAELGHAERDDQIHQGRSARNRPGIAKTIAARRPRRKRRQNLQINLRRRSQPSRDIASEKKPAPVAFNKDDFKNDPLIQKALEIFKGTIVEVRA